MRIPSHPASWQLSHLILVLERMPLLLDAVMLQTHPKYSTLDEAERMDRCEIRRHSS